MALETHEYNIELKPWVDRVFSDQGYELEKVETHFNGVLNGKIDKIHMFGLGSSVSYSLEEVFSYPLDKDKESNRIIVNAPSSIKKILVDLDPDTAELIGINPVILLQIVDSKQLSDKNGVDPDMTTFMAEVTYKINKHVNIADLKKIPVIITCYEFYASKIVRF